MNWSNDFRRGRFVKKTARRPGFVDARLENSNVKRWWPVRDVSRFSPVRFEHALEARVDRYEKYGRDRKHADQHGVSYDRCLNVHAHTDHLLPVCATGTYVTKSDV